jgi:hypothetical protein
MATHINTYLQSGLVGWSFLFSHPLFSFSHLSFSSYLDAIRCDAYVVEDGKVEVHPGGKCIAARNNKQPNNRVLVHTHTVPTRIILPFSTPFFAPVPGTSTVTLSLALAGASRPKLSNKVIDVSAVPESEERDSQRQSETVRECQRQTKQRGTET